MLFYGNVVPVGRRDDALKEELEEAVVEAGRCLQCGLCSESCPSARSGGIAPDEVMAKVAEGDLDDERIWRCAMCHRCASVCPEDLDPSRVITALRNRSAAKGEHPKRFEDSAQRFLATGRAFPCTGMTRNMRKELGLPPLEVDRKAVAELKELIKGTRGWRKDD